jgi:hypothetical protein
MRSKATTVPVFAVSVPGEGVAPPGQPTAVEAPGRPTTGSASCSGGTVHHWVSRWLPLTQLQSVGTPTSPPPYDSQRHLASGLAPVGPAAGGSGAAALVGARADMVRAGSVRASRVSAAAAERRIPVRRGRGFAVPARLSC